jgi:hypothetical protein
MTVGWVRVNFAPISSVLLMTSELCNGCGGSEGVNNCDSRRRWFYFEEEQYKSCECGDEKTSHVFGEV